MSDIETSRLYEVAIRLLEEGVSPEKIHRSTGLPLEHIETLPAARTTRIIDPDEVPAEVAKVVSLVIDEAHAIIESGTPAMKLRLIQLVLGRAMSQLRNQSPKAMDDLRDRLDALTSGIVDSDDPDEV